MNKFAAGLITGIALTAMTAYAAGLRHWSQGDIQAANEIVGSRSGLRFSIDQPPPDPDRVQTLTVQARAIGGLAQNLAVIAQPGDSTVPPDPCFVAHLTPPGPPDVPPDPCRGGGGVCLQLLHPDQVTIVAADGSPLVCQPPGPPIVPVDTVP